MASLLGRTVQEAQASLTSNEFLDWVAFLDWRDTEEFRREDYYLAQIAAAVERGHVKNPSSVTLRKKLLTFTTKKRARSTEEEMQQSKNFWLGLVKVAERNQRTGRRT